MGLNRDSLARLGAFSLYGFPFSVKAPGTAMERLRRRSLQVRFAARRHAWQRALLFVFCTFTYPVMIALEAWHSLRVMKQTHPGAGFSAWMRIYGLALSRNIPPVEYVAYGFEDPTRRSQSSHYLYWQDLPALQELNALRGADNQDVQDKDRFASICAEHDLDHVRALGVFRRNGIEPAMSVLAEDELWVKPLKLSASQGAEFWLKQADGYRASNGRTLTCEALYRELSQGDFLVQRRLKNHPALDALTDGRVAVLRVVTGLGIDGSVELLGNYLLLPTGPGITTTGGTAVAVRWEDGKMMRKVGVFGLVEDIVDPKVVLPFFAEAVGLCRRAHATGFQRFATLGWDVVITPEGPLLLETNSGWGAFAIQQLWGPLGQTALPRLAEQVWENAAPNKPREDRNVRLKGENS